MYIKIGKGSRDGDVVRNGLADEVSLDISKGFGLVEEKRSIFGLGQSEEDSVLGYGGESPN